MPADTAHDRLVRFLRTGEDEDAMTLDIIAEAVGIPPELAHDRAKIVAAVRMAIDRARELEAMARGILQRGERWATHLESCDCRIDLRDPKPLRPEAMVYYIQQAEAARVMAWRALNPHGTMARAASETAPESRPAASECPHTSEPPERP